MIMRPSNLGTLLLLRLKIERPSPPQENVITVYIEMTYKKL